MSNYQKGDIVEFFNGENTLEFGLIISVQVSDTISAIVVSGFAPNRPQWISTDRVKNHWKNLKGYVSTCDILKAENESLKAEIERIKMLIICRRDWVLKTMIEHNAAQFVAECNTLNTLLEAINNPDNGKGGEDE